MNNAELAAHQSERPAQPRLPHSAPIPVAACSRGGRTAFSCPDNGNEYGPAFTKTIHELSATQTRIRAGRPQTNGHVENLHKTILYECWRPAFARYRQLRYSGLRRD